MHGKLFQHTNYLQIQTTVHVVALRCLSVSLLFRILRIPKHFVFMDKLIWEEI
jgi:hypothetical protein